MLVYGYIKGTRNNNWYLTCKQFPYIQFRNVKESDTIHPIENEWMIVV